jgi:hypothetical protein
MKFIYYLLVRQGIKFYDIFVFESLCFAIVEYYYPVKESGLAYPANRRLVQAG